MTNNKTDREWAEELAADLLTAQATGNHTGTFFSMATKAIAQAFAEIRKECEAGWLPIAEWSEEKHGKYGWISDGAIVTKGYWDSWPRDENGNLFTDEDDDEEIERIDRWCSDDYFCDPVSFEVKFFRPFEPLPAAPKEA